MPRITWSPLTGLGHYSPPKLHNFRICWTCFLATPQTRVFWNLESVLEGTFFRRNSVIRLLDFFLPLERVHLLPTQCFVRKFSHSNFLQEPFIFPCALIGMMGKQPFAYIFLWKITASNHGNYWVGRNIWSFSIVLACGWTTEPMWWFLSWGGTESVAW